MKAFHISVCTKMANLGLSVQTLGVSVLGLVFLCKTWLFVLCLGCLLGLVCLCYAWVICTKLGIPVLGLSSYFHLPPVILGIALDPFWFIPTLPAPYNNGCQLICITQKTWISLGVDRIWPKERDYHFALWKDSQIGLIFLCHVHLECSLPIVVKKCFILTTDIFFSIIYPNPPCVR